MEKRQIYEKLNFYLSWLECDGRLMPKQSVEARAASTAMIRPIVVALEADLATAAKPTDRYWVDVPLRHTCIRVGFDPPVHPADKKMAEMVVSAVEHAMDDESTLDDAVKRIDELNVQAKNWQETAAQFHQGMKYYRELVVQCGQSLGDDAYTQDDGGTSDNVLCDKVPELVDRKCWQVHGLQAEVDAMKAELATATRERDEARASIHILTHPPYGQPLLLVGDTPAAEPPATASDPDRCWKFPHEDLARVRSSPAAIAANAWIEAQMPRQQILPEILARTEAIEATVAELSRTVNSLRRDLDRQPAASASNRV